MAKAKVTTADAPTKCRVLTDGLWGKADSVVSLSGDELVAAVEAGQVDPDADAVAYAESLVVALPEIAPAV